MQTRARVHGLSPPCIFPSPVGGVGSADGWGATRGREGVGGIKRFQSVEPPKGPTHGHAAPLPCGMWGRGARGIKHIYILPVCTHAMHAYVSECMPCTHMPTCIRHARICRCGHAGVCIHCRCMQGMHAPTMNTYICMSTSTYACMACACGHMHACHACVYACLIPCAPPSHIPHGGGGT